MGSNHMHENFRNNKRKSKKKEEEIPAPPVRNEIPMYDPQTGEPNPLYEELTGRPNPLLQIRKTNNLGHMPVQYEPKRKNRWLVHFPEHFKIESWCVTKTQRPSMKIVEKRFLGIKMGMNVEWEKMSFEFVDPIGPSVSERLYELMDDELTENFDYTLEMLDPTGVVVEKWLIKDCEIEAISLGSLDYAEDGIAKCFMLIKPGKVILQK
jgi:hypothetical protein